MRMDLYCPLELRGYELLHDDREHVRAYLTLFNLARRKVSRFEASLCWTDSSTGERAETEFIADELRAAKRALFTLALSTDQLPRADEAQIRFLRVEYEDGSPAWVADEARLTDVPEPAPLEGRRQNALMAFAGSDARNYAGTFPGGWLCACGRGNPGKARHCIRCGRLRDVQLSLFTREAFERHGVTSLPSSAQPELVPLKAPRRDVPWEKALSRRFRRERAALIQRTLLMLLLALAVVLCSTVWRGMLERERAAAHRTVQSTQAPER